MSETIDIHGEGAALLLYVHGYENPTATDETDANWLKCEAHVKMPGFTGQVQVALTTGDLERFAAELRGALDGSVTRAELATDEEQVRAIVQLTGTGRASIEAEIRLIGRPQAKLTFACDSDQTYLHRALSDIDTALRAFPVRRCGTR